jgi:hypothetical protein
MQRLPMAKGMESGCQIKALGSLKITSPGYQPEAEQLRIFRVIPQIRLSPEITAR